MRTSLAVTCFTLLSGSLAFGTGCQAPAPSATLRTNDGGASDMGPTAGDPDLLPPDDGEIDPPALDPIEQVTVYSTVPLHGVSEPSSTVLVRSTDGKTTSVDVSSAGRFCLDVPLTAGKTNTFSVTALDLNGNQSVPVSISVKQQGSPAQAPTAPQPTNASLGGTAVSYQLGALSFQPDDELVIDGQATTGFDATVTNPWPWSTVNPNVVVKLHAPSRINQIKAYAPSDCLFEQPMELYYSVLDAPSPPPIAPAGTWVKVTSTVSDNKLSATASFGSTIATHIALVWPDADQWGTGNCGFGTAQYGLAELQAWTVANIPPPAPRAPSCVGGAL